MAYYGLGAAGAFVVALVGVRLGQGAAGWIVALVFGWVGALSLAGWSRSDEAVREAPARTRRAP